MAIRLYFCSCPPCEPCLSLSCLLCSDLIFACFTSRAQRGVTSTKKCSHTSPHCPHVHQSFTTSGALQSEAAHRHLLGTMQVIPILSVLVIVIIVARSLGTRHFCSDLRKICTNNPHPQVKQSFGPKIIGAQKWRGWLKKCLWEVQWLPAGHLRVHCGRGSLLRPSTPLPLPPHNR